MRLSLKKGAHAVLSSAAYRKFEVSAWFWQMWDTAGLPLKPLTDSTTTYGCPTFAPAYVGRKRWATRISYFALLATTTCAALRKESRMQIIKATGLHRKSGGSPTTAFRFRPYDLFLSRPGFLRANSRAGTPGSQNRDLGHQLKVWRSQFDFRQNEAQ